MRAEFMHPFPAMGRSDMGLLPVSRGILRSEFATICSGLRSGGDRQAFSIDFARTICFY